MKIWVIGRNYPLKKNRLQGSFELEQAKMLAKEGHKVTYLALPFHPYRHIHKWGAESWEENGIQVRVYSAHSLPGRLQLECTSYRRRLWQRLLQSAEEASHGLPDVIHVHYPSMISEPAVLAAYQVRGVKIVSTEHWSKVLLHQLSKYDRRRLRWHMEKADRVAAVGRLLAVSMQSLASSTREVTLIPNMSSPLFKPCQEKKEDGIFRFVTVGRLLSLRQYDKVIDAFDAVFHGREDVTLTLVGSGEEYEKLKKRIKKHRAEGNIFLAGIQNRQTCAETVAGANCLICYSKYETFGVPVIEAWSCGVPVIVSEHFGFLQNEAGHKLGLPADAKDPESLRRAIETMYQTAGDFSPAFIAAYAEAHFSAAAMYQELLSLYGQKEEDAVT